MGEEEQVFNVCKLKCSSNESVKRCGRIRRDNVYCKIYTAPQASYSKYSSLTNCRFYKAVEESIISCV